MQLSALNLNVKPSNQEIDFTLRSLFSAAGNRSEKPLALRLDGRGVHEARDVEIALSTVNGAASLCEVTLRNKCDPMTRVFAHVTAEVTVPSPERPNEGMLQFTLERLPSSGPEVAGTNNASSSSPLLLMLEKVLRESRVIDVEGLCIVAGVHCWAVRCHVVVAEDGGSLADACCLASLTALSHFRRPSVTVEAEEEITVHSPEEKAPEPLSLHDLPLVVSFALFSPYSAVNGSMFANAVSEKKKSDNKRGPVTREVRLRRWMAVVDPTAREEDVARGSVLVVVNSHGEICGMWKTGSPALSPESIVDLTKIACTVRNERARTVKRAVGDAPFAA